MSTLLSGAPIAAFLMDGLTIVCVASTAMLYTVFGFLYFAEKSLKDPDKK